MLRKADLVWFDQINRPNLAIMMFNCIENPFLSESRIRTQAVRCLRKMSLVEAVLCVGLILSFSVGCVQRRMTIRSNPPGALVYVDDYQVGTTPVSTDFVYYGTRKIRLIKDGYDTLTVQ